MADPAAGNIFALTIGSDATPTPIKGTQQTSARGMDIVTENGQAVIYFSGKDAQGQPAVFKVPAAGADTPEIILTAFNATEAGREWQTIDSATLPDFDDASVQTVYEIICESPMPPNCEEHWEGYQARLIVAALRSVPPAPEGEG